MQNKDAGNMPRNAVLLILVHVSLNRDVYTGLL